MLVNRILLSYLCSWKFTIIGRMISNYFQCTREGRNEVAMVVRRIAYYNQGFEEYG